MNHLFIPGWKLISFNKICPLRHTLTVYIKCRLMFCDRACISSSDHILYMQNTLLLDFLYLYTFLPTQYLSCFRESAIIINYGNNGRYWTFIFFVNDHWIPWLTAKLLQTFDRLYLRERCVNGWSCILTPASVSRVTLYYVWVPQTYINEHIIISIKMT